MMSTDRIPCEEKRIEITTNDLPVYCPTRNERIWDAHPRVYLTLENGRVTCPYCGTEFILKETANG